MKKVCVITLMLLLSVPISASAQDPIGVLDSAYIICKKNGYFGSGLSRVVIPVRFFSDNKGDEIAAFEFESRIEGKNIVSVDTAVKKAFAGSAFRNFNNLAATKMSSADPSVPPFLMEYGAVTFSGVGIIGDSILFKVVLNVNDTGTICMDTSHAGAIPEHTNFTTEQAFGYVPGWGGPYCCRVELHPPGDVNLDKLVNIADAVAGAAYIFRARELGSVQAIDVNADCRWTLADLVYLANYVFRFGPAPQIGCLP